MKRTELIGRLLKEGFSEKTLVNFTDKQLNDLSERIVTTTQAMATNPEIQKLANDPNKTVEVKETLKGKQKNIDKNHNGKIDADDFAILNKEKKGETKEDVNEADMGLTIKSTPKSIPLFGGAPKKSSSSKKKSTPKKKEENSEEGEVDESLHGIMIGATKEKLKKDLGRDPEDHEVEKELNKFVDSWKKDNEPKEKKKKGYIVPKPPVPNFNGHKKKEEEKEGDYHNERSGKALEKSKEDFPQLKNIKKCDDCGKVTSKCTCKKEKEVNELLRFYDDDGNPIKNKKGKQDAVSTKSKNFEKKTKSKKCADCGEYTKDCKCDDSHLEENRNIKNWVKGLVENKEFHSFTSKNEIMELIQTKLTESDTMIQHGPKVKKGHNGIPEFMSYDAIVSAEPKTAPSKPAPSTKPGTRPTPTRREDPRKTPFQPGPGPNPKPKAKIAEEKKK
jgi:Ca2+-binding EF-hand superfamily protein